MTICTFLLVLQCIFLLEPVSPATSPNHRDDVINLINNLTQLQQMMTQQGKELETTKTALEWAITELQSTNEELIAVKSELQHTTGDLIGVKSDFIVLGDKCTNETSVLSSKLLKTEAELLSVKSDLDKREDKHTNETQNLSDKLAQTEAELANTTRVLSIVQTDLKSTKTELNSTNVRLRVNSANIQSQVDQLTHDLEVHGDKCHNETQELSDKLVKTEAELSNTSSFVSMVQTELSSTKTVLNSTNFRLDATSADIQSVKEQMKLDLDALEDKCQNETHELLDKLAQTEAELATNASFLSFVQKDLTSTKTDLNLTKILLGKKSDYIESIKDQLTNMTYLSNLRNIGFLMSSKAGDNGIFHAPVVYDIHENSTLMFSQTTLDKGNAFAVKNGTMTAPVTGIYVLWVNINMEKNGFSVRLFKSPNGETVGEKDSQSGQLAFSTPVYLNAGETVAVQILGENLLFPQTPVSEFGGVLIKAF